MQPHNVETALEESLRLWKHASSSELNRENERRLAIWGFYNSHEHACLGPFVKALEAHRSRGTKPAKSARNKIIIAT
jgi:hypothetical protein